MKALALLCVIAVACTDGCRTTTKGWEYRGTTSTTENGYTCQRWNRNYPHTVTTKDASTVGAWNYCRNPKRSAARPWCYTTSQKKKWDFCKIPFCANCRTTTKGAEYRGWTKTTEKGYTCQRWDRNSPWTVQYKDASTVGHWNYCRNPKSSAARPWCYTTSRNKKWDFCKIPFCANCRTTTKGAEYRGWTKTTQKGYTCQRWDRNSPWTVKFKDSSTVGHWNYCRNPKSSAKQPWCYTTSRNLEWDYCKIPFCSSTGGTSSGGTSLKDLSLFAHNKARAMHQYTPPVTWDYKIAATAQKWANYIKRYYPNGIGGVPLNKIHEQNTGYGENICYKASGVAGAVYGPSDCVYMWYAEEWKYGSYNYARQSQSDYLNTGHFTQLVWRASKKIGCGRSSWTSGKWSRTIMVCRYSPPGNYAGRYKANVKPRKSGAGWPTIANLDPRGACVDKAPKSSCRGFKSFCKTNAVVKGACYKYCMC